MAERFGVREFHWEDLNPTASERRIRTISRQILKRHLSVRWKLASGSKIETMKAQTLRREATLRPQLTPWIRGAISGLIVA